MSIQNDLARIYLLGYIRGKRKSRDEPMPSMTDPEIIKYMKDINPDYHYMSLRGIVYSLDGSNYNGAGQFEMLVS